MDDDLAEAGGIPPDDFTDAIERIVEVADYPLLIPNELATRLDQIATDFIVERELLDELVAALVVGHVVLQGPPGTGKSSLARAISQAMNVSLNSATAHENWTTFDVVGRLDLELDQNGTEHTVPLDGVFPRAVIACANSISTHFDEPTWPQATWLAIDELNRAPIDRAFGELFSVLGTDESPDIELGYRPVGDRRMRLPARFRIIGTINTFDRQYVQTMSQAVRRRFSFVTINPPAAPAEGVQPAIDPQSAEPAMREIVASLERAATRVGTRAHAGAPVDQAAWDDFISARSGPITSLFDLIWRVRYAKSIDPEPHLPLGTAQVIDVLELFFTKELLASGHSDGVGGVHSMDWACSIKLAPLFESDSVELDKLQDFSARLSSPFDKQTRARLDEIVSAGGGFVG
ncbi:MAG: AAA family ATPase [Rhodoglobus sp.]